MPLGRYGIHGMIKGIASVPVRHPCLSGSIKSLAVIAGHDVSLLTMNTELPPESSEQSATTMPDTEETTPSEATTDLNPQIQEILDTISGVLGNLPDYVTEFFQEYKRPLITVGLIFAAIISVKLLLAVLGAVNEIPLLAPTFELVGLGYTAWFVYRFLLKDANRKELTSTLSSVRDQILGK